MWLICALTQKVLCKEACLRCSSEKIVEIVSFTGALTSQYVVKPVKATCKTVHSIPKETCQKVTRFDEPYKTACFGGSTRHQKMDMCMNYGCANLWSSSMSFLRVTCDTARGLQCPKETCKIWTGRKSIGDTFFQTTMTHVINFFDLSQW